MDKEKLKKMVQEMSESERDELGRLLLESVLERWSEEPDPEHPGQTLGDASVIVDGDGVPEGDDDALDEN